MSALIHRRTILAGIAGLALAGCAHQTVRASPRSLEDVIRNQTEARGGAEALDRVRSVLIEVEIVERGQTLRGRYAAEASGLVRIDIYAGGNFVYSEGVDRDGVWLWPRSEPAPRASAAVGAANALTNGAEGHLFGIHRFAERGHRLRMMPSERIDGIDYVVIEVVFTTGQTSYFYIDPASWLTVRRRDQRAYHPDLSQVQQRVETLFSDFQSVEGVLEAHRNVDIDLGTGEQLSTGQVISRTINPSLPDGVFERGYTPS
jgi:hypothetical protein